MYNHSIEIHKLNFKVDNFELKDIHISVPKGMIVGLVGKNGAGKTTLLNILAGIYEKDSGSIRLSNVTRYENEKSYLDQFGIMPDYPFVNGFLKATKLAKILRKSYASFDEAFYFKYLEKLEVPLDVRVAKLSLGMQKKLGLIAVMSLNKNILILDEPTANIDPISKREILNMLQTYMEDEQKTIIYATHQTDELDKVADYVLMLHQGHQYIFEDKETLIDTHRIIKVNHDTFKQLDKNYIIGYEQTALGYTLLTNHPSYLEKYDSHVIRPNIEDILYFYSRRDQK